MNFSFDLGGFTGSIIGVLFAYLIFSKEFNNFRRFTIIDKQLHAINHAISNLREVHQTLININRKVSFPLSEKDKFVLKQDLIEINNFSEKSESNWLLYPKTIVSTFNSPIIEKYININENLISINFTFLFMYYLVSPDCEFESFDDFNRFERELEDTIIEMNGYAYNIKNNLESHYGTISLKKRIRMHKEKIKLKKKLKKLSEDFGHEVF